MTSIIHKQLDNIKKLQYIFDHYNVRDNEQKDLAHFPHIDNLFETDNGNIEFIDNRRTDIRSLRVKLFNPDMKKRTQISYCINNTTIYEHVNFLKDKLNTYKDRLETTNKHDFAYLYKKDNDEFKFFIRFEYACLVHHKDGKNYIPNCYVIKKINDFIHIFFEYDSDIRIPDLLNDSLIIKPVRTFNDNGGIIESDFEKCENCSFCQAYQRNFDEELYYNKKIVHIFKNWLYIGRELYNLENDFRKCHSLIKIDITYCDIDFKSMDERFEQLLENKVFWIKATEEDKRKDEEEHKIIEELCGK